MMMGLELLCLLLAIWASKLSMYSSPDFDWKESFCFSLSQKGLPVDKKIYPPCLGMTWESFDTDLVQQRHRAMFSHVLCFTPSQSELAQCVQEYFNIPVNIGSLEVENIAEHVVRGSQRLLFLCKQEEIQGLLQLLHQHPGMRDVLYGVVVIDPIFSDEWMETYFDQDILDTEANRPVPYIFGFSELESPIPHPRESKTGWKSILTISLGIFDTDNPNIPLAIGALFSALYS